MPHGDQSGGAINAARGYHTAPFTCVGGFSRTGPAWLSFVRSDGAVVHAYEVEPGECGGLAVNGVRWLIDRGSAWNPIARIVRVSAGRG
ncbi:MAG TPA: hypothetical protein VFA78_07500 [Chloroflexota bacterium]|nr:hypothetical protein [Chloroflexota bacterium]